MAWQWRALGAVVNGRSGSFSVQPITALPPRTRMVMFGQVVELIAVEADRHAAFPRARLVTIRPDAGGDPVAVLVPADFAPMVLPCRRR